MSSGLLCGECDTGWSGFWGVSVQQVDLWWVWDNLGGFGALRVQQVDLWFVWDSL